MQGKVYSYSINIRMYFDSKEGMKELQNHSVAVRPLEVPADRVSKTIGRRLERAGRFDRDNNVYNADAYLIAQLGKNYTDGINEKISGSDLLGAASEFSVNVTVKTKADSFS